MSNEQVEQVARALNLAGWTCSDGAHEPGDYGRCEACANTCDLMARAAIAAMTTTPDVGVLAEVRALAVDWHDALDGPGMDKPGEGDLLARLDAILDREAGR